MAAAGPSPDDAKLVRTLAPLPTTKRGYGIHVKSHPKGDRMVYTSGKLVIIRSIGDPTISEVFSEHKANVNVATFAPNGNWVASGDEEGNVIIWSYPQMKVKNEVRIGKTVYDIDWDADSTRIVAGGDGAQNKAKVFNWDSGNNLGEITMCSQAVLAVSYRKERPFKIVTASEDLTVNLYDGPPFKYNSSYKGHARYPNNVRFSPDGSTYLSVGADSKIVLFNGTDGAVLKEFPESKEGHKGAIYSFSWSPDGKQILTASADKTAKIWDVESATVVKTFTFGGKKPGTNDMQVSTLWTKEAIITVSLSGVINYLDINNPDTPSRIIQGHKDNILSIAVDPKNGVFYTASTKGELTKWDFKSGEATWFSGKGLEDKVISAVAPSADGAHLATVSYDNVIRFNDVKSVEVSSDPSDLGGQPMVLAAHPKDSSLFAVGLAQDKLVIVRGGRAVSTTSLNYQPTAISFSTDGSRLFVGGKQKKVTIYTLDKDQPKQAGEWTEHDKPVTAVHESPDGRWIVSTDKETSIYIREASSLALKNKTGFRFHKGAITDAAWSPSGKRLATASLDWDIFLWHDFTNFSTDRVRIKFAHTAGVDAVKWWDDNTLISVGADRTIRIWDIPAKQ